MSFVKKISKIIRLSITTLKKSKAIENKDKNIKFFTIKKKHFVCIKIPINFILTN